MFGRLHLSRAAVVSASVVLGLGGVAAAAGTGGLDPVLSEDEVVETPTTEVDPTSTTTDETTTSTTIVVTQPPAEALVCPEGAQNHGDAVSSVATDKTSTGAEHGAAVSEMAQSDCGKDAEEDPEVLPLEDTTTTALDETTTTVAGDEIECPEGAKNHGDAVSSVAKDRSTKGRDHGKAVSQMARSDCGKN